MRILVIGASKGTGALAVQRALTAGHQVTAFARSPHQLGVDHTALTKLRGDFHQEGSVGPAVRGHDAVIITASAGSLKGFKEKPDYFSQGTGYVIEAMRAHGVKRLVALSALGTGESRALAGFFLDKLLISFLLKHAYADHERQEDLVKQSGLDWVIARPSRLTDGPARGAYLTKTAIEPVPSSIARADVADFLVRAVETDTWLRQAVQLGG